MCRGDTTTRRLKPTWWALICICIFTVLSYPSAAAGDSSEVLDSTPQAPGSELFAQHCSQCHEHPVSGVPLKSLLMQMAPNAVYSVLTWGVMRVQASSLSDPERRQIVKYLTGLEPGGMDSPPTRCRDDGRWLANEA